jgi:uncharacterized membrane protein (DUF2068 family)
MADLPPVINPKKQRAPTLYAIIAIKFIKGFALLIAAFGVYMLIGTDLQRELSALLRANNLDPENKTFRELGQWLATITPENVRLIAIGIILYSLFSLVEGTGLIFRVSWAGWLAIGESAFFIPIEIYDMVHKFSWLVLIVLILNIIIVAYLYRNRFRLFKH